MISTTQQQQETSKLSNNDGQVIIELASVVDMYGTGSDIIGRRSFGGFCKSSITTYDTALNRRTDDEDSFVNQYFRMGSYKHLPLCSTTL